MIHNSHFATAHCIPTETKFAHNLGLFGGYGGSVSRPNISPKNNLQERLDRRLPLPHGEGDDPGNPEMARLLEGDVRVGCDGYYVSEPLEEGAIYEKNWLPGGGGYGDPIERDISLVEKDLDAGLVSPRAAENIYGVKAFFDQTTGDWKVDVDQTEALRGTIRKERLEKSVPVSEWWGKERGRILGRTYHPCILGMYRETFRLSPTWEKEYRSFWYLPEGFDF